MGLRGIRLSLKERKFLDVQLAAMLRASALGPVRILLPMITTVSELKKDARCAGPGRAALEAPRRAPAEDRCRRSA